MKKLLILSVVLFSSVMIFAQGVDSNDQKSSSYVGTNIFVSEFFLSNNNRSVTLIS